MRVAVAFLLVFCFSCASLRESFQANYCNYEGAYSAGTNDANGGHPMSGAPAIGCPEESRAEVRRGYREGYSNAQKNRPVQLNINLGSSAKRECHRNYGQEVCGYHCIEAYGQWYCAGQPTDNCIENYSKVRCGSNCRKDFGEIHCD